MTENQMIKVTAEKISKFTGYSPEEVAIIKNTIAKKVSNTELAYFLNICKSVNLNPFNKEIWCYKDNKGNLLVFAGRDGFLKKAQESKLWNGMTSFEVCENDVFEMNVTQAEIKHNPNFKDRGKLIGAYAIVKPKGCELPTIEWADFKIYNKGWNVWKTNPIAMIKKVAETHALKKAYGITGLQSEYDYEINDGIATAIDTTESELDILKRNIINKLENYTGKDKEAIRQDCIEREKSGTFTIEYAKTVAKKIGMQYE